VYWYYLLVVVVVVVVALSRVVGLGTSLWGILGQAQRVKKIVSHNHM
jgi:hypothetical protein